MFIFHYYKYAFQFSKFFEYVKEKWWKVLIFFFIVSFVSIFPMNLLIIQEDGWRLDFIEESFASETPTWQLPDNCGITARKLVCDTDQVYEFEHRGITYVINSTEEDYANITEKQVLLLEDKIVYANGQGEHMIGYDYQGFEDDVSFRSLNLATGEERDLMYESFGRQLESSFGDYIVFYTLMVNSITSIGLYAFFVLIMSLVMQLFRFGYTSFITFGESMKLVVFAMGVPSVVSFVVGFLEPSFSPVVFQFGIGIIIMVVMLKYAKKIFR